jgi:opacity protein-like surface antigen
MKTFTSLWLALAMTAPLARGGTETYSGKEIQPTRQTEVCNWYRDTEWNVGLWGAYAFTGTANNRNSLSETLSTGDTGSYDQFLSGDHAWGGGADFKYFFMKYFGIGIEGFALAAHGTRYDIDTTGPAVLASKDSDHHLVGAALATVTVRYPIGCSRFAPYVWAGGGGIFGGHRDDLVVTPAGEQMDHETETRGMGQFGGGMEVRITPNVGWISDFSWNVVDGPHNDFGMVRSGLNLAF